MQVPETRFVRIDGTRVSVAVSSAAEARHAVKELRLVKREALRHRRELAKAEKSAKAAATAKKASGKPRRSSVPRAGAAAPVIDNPLSYVWHSLAAVASAAATGDDEAPAKPGRKATPAGHSATSIARNVARTEEIIAGIDACLVQIEARLLDEKAPKRRAARPAP